MAFNVFNNIIIVVGQKGYGKTYFARLLAQKLRGGHYLFLDVSASFEESAYAASVDRESLELFFNRHMKDLLLTVSEENVLEILDIIAAMIPEQYLDMVLVVDEVNLFCTSQKMYPALRKIVALGRHSGVDLIVTARDPQEINPRLRSQADAIVSFRLTEPAALSWAADRNAEVAPLLATLEPRRWEVLTASPRILPLLHRLKK